MNIDLKTLHAKFSIATKIYYGKDNHCRCGCGGNYADNNSRTFKTYLTKLAKLNSDDILKVDHHETYINISLANNRAFTVYTD